MRERAMVPEPEFESYYGRPVIKRPVWKQPDVPLYLFVGGMSGAAAVLAEGAELTGRPALTRVCRLLAASGAAAGTVALIHDLGRPERFLNMLRVFKPTSPLSMGSYVLASFGTLSAAAAGSNLTGLLPGVGRAAGAAAGVLGPVLATYTSALIADTAVPVWHEAYRELPFVFAGSGACAAGGLAMIATPTRQAGAARRMAVLGAGVELASSEVMQRRLGMLAEPLHEKRPGMLLRAAKALTAAGAAATVVGGRSRALSVLAGGALAAGSVLLRFGIFQAGLASADDPKYTVVPQRERLERRVAARA